MLIDDNRAEYTDAIGKMVGKINGNNFTTHKLTTGIYERPDFGRWPWLSGWNDSIKDFENYGVCDNYQQILDKFPVLNEESNRKFIIMLTPVLKSNQSSTGGWRWHKWGEYIGKQVPTCEYLFDEPKIEKVYTFTIYEKEGE